jgi:hypothetical protein
LQVGFVAEGVTVSVGVRVSVGVDVTVCVPVAVGVRVAVKVPEDVGDVVWVSVGKPEVRVDVAVQVTVAVSVGVPVQVEVWVDVIVEVRVAEGVGVAVAETVRVGVAVTEGVRVRVALKAEVGEGSRGARGGETGVEALWQPRKTRPRSGAQVQTEKRPIVFKDHPRRKLRRLALTRCRPGKPAKS